MSITRPVGVVGTLLAALELLAAAAICRIGWEVGGKIWHML